MKQEEQVGGRGTILRSKKNKNIFEIRMLKIATLISAKAARFFPLKRN